MQDIFNKISKIKTLRHTWFTWVVVLILDAHVAHKKANSKTNQNQNKIKTKQNNNKQTERQTGKQTDRLTDGVEMACLSSELIGTIDK